MSVKNKKQRNVIILIIMIGSFLTALTQTVLTVALPSIMGDFNINANAGQWLTTAYLLVLGVMIPTTAYLINKFTTRKLFIASMLLFFVGCIISILSRNYGQMIFSRILQAIGAGVIMQLVQVSMIKLYPLEERGKAMGIYGFTVGVAPTIGPIAAGYIIDILGWRSVFYILALITIMDIVFAFIFLKNVGELKESRLDTISVILSSLGFGGILTGVSDLGSYGITNALTYMPLIIGVISIVAFTIRQFKIDIPLLELKVFKNINFTISTILIIIIYAAMTAATIIISLYVQSVRGYSAMTSGLLMLPGSMLMAILSPITGRILDSYGPRTLTIMGFISFGTGTFAFSNLGENTSLIYLSIMFCLRMIGIAFLLMPLTTWGLNSLENDEISHGSAINGTLRQVAGAIGSAILITIMTNVASKSTSNSIVSANIQGMDTSFRIATILIIIGLISSIIFVKERTFEDNDINEKFIENEPI